MAKAFDSQDSANVVMVILRIVRTMRKCKDPRTRATAVKVEALLLKALLDIQTSGPVERPRRRRFGLRTMATGVLMVAGFCLSGCTAISVDSSVLKPNPGSAIYLIAGNGLEADPFLKAEVLDQARRALIKRGYTPVTQLRESDLFAKVEIVNLPPQTYQTTTAVPVTGMVSSGGQTLFRGAYSSYSSAGAQGYFTGSTYTDPQYGTVGVVPITNTYTENYYCVFMVAGDIREMKLTNKDAFVWRITGLASGAEGKRKTIKSIIRGMTPWIGKDSGGSITVFQ